jgi:hypothetical protein
MKTIRQSQVVRTGKGRCRVRDIVIFDVLGAVRRGSGATEAAARDVVRSVADALKTPCDDFNGKAFLVVPADAHTRRERIAAHCRRPFGSNGRSRRAAFPKIHFPLTDARHERSTSAFGRHGAGYLP